MALELSWKTGFKVFLAMSALGLVWTVLTLPFERRDSTGIVPPASSGPGTSTCDFTEPEFPSSDGNDHADVGRHDRFRSGKGERRGCQPRHRDSRVE